jgi:hypothetical protein
MIKKEELNIVKKDNKYRIAMRQSFLKFFYRWVEVTWIGEGQIDEEPIEFNSFNEAKEFIELVSE